jgi:hypothetical protein
MGFLIPKEKPNVTHRNCLLVVVGSDSAERLKTRLLSLIIAMHSAESGCGAGLHSIWWNFVLEEARCEVLC